MKFMRKIGVAFGIKGLLCLASLTMIALALVSYTASVTITPREQFTIGAESDSWYVYVNDVDKVRYLPGGVEPLEFNEENPDTYAFKVVTDDDQACAVKIELTEAVNSSKFSRFEIMVKSWNGLAWVDEQLYNASTGSETIDFINGLTPGAAGYIHQDASAEGYYLITVIYSYAEVAPTDHVTVTFQYTPLPQDSF